MAQQTMQYNLSCSEGKFHSLLWLKDANRMSFEWIAITHWLWQNLHWSGGFKLGKCTWKNLVAFAYNVQIQRIPEERTNTGLGNLCGGPIQQGPVQAAKSTFLCSVKSAWHSPSELQAMLQERTVTMQLADWSCTPHQLTIGDHYSFKASILCIYKESVRFESKRLCLVLAWAKTQNNKGHPGGSQSIAATTKKIFPAVAKTPGHLSIKTKQMNAGTPILMSCKWMNKSPEITWDATEW